MKSFLAALRFLTIVPIPGNWGTGELDLAHSVPWFPVIGLLMGVATAAIAWGLTQLAPALIVSIAILVLLLSYSGGLHLDGLADSADGLLSSRSRERMLEIMKDSHVGAMGVMAIVVLLLAKFAALASLPAKLVPAAALLMPLAGRSMIVVHIALLPYARPSGLGAVFYKRRPGLAAAWAVLLLAAVAWGVLGLSGLAVWGVSLAVTLLLAIYLRRKLGGATGDTFGALCEIVEVLPPLCLALWPAGIR